MNDQWQRIRETLISDADQYRSRHSSWTTVYYGATLSVFGIFIAVSSISSEESVVIGCMRVLVAILSVIGCYLVISNIRKYIDLYEAIGYDKIPEQPEGLDKYNKGLEEEMIKFTNKAATRRRKDCFIRGCLYVSIVLLLLSLIYPYLPECT